MATEHTKSDEALDVEIYRRLMAVVTDSVFANAEGPDFLSGLETGFKVAASMLSDAECVMAYFTEETTAPANARPMLVRAAEIAQAIAGHLWCPRMTDREADALYRQMNGQEA